MVQPHPLRNTPAELRERDGELVRLGAALDATARGEGRLVVVEGAAGLGKTSLLQQAAAMSAERGLPTLVARGSELEASFAFGVVRQLYDPLLARNPDARSGLLAGAASVAAAPLGLEADPAAIPRGPGFEVLHGLYWLTLNVADDGPLVIVVDDAHWVDEPSLRFLAFLATRVPGGQISMLIATRHDSGIAERDALLAEIRALGTDVLAPQALSEGATTAELEARLRSPVDQAFAAACHHATDGNPFLVAELCRELQSLGVEPDASAVARVQSLAPRGIAERVVTRLAATATAAAAVGRALAVLGDGHRLDEVFELAQVGADDGDAAVDALCRTGILTAEPGVGFIHPIVRSAVYADVPPRERELLHRRAAALLADRGASDEQVAGQLLATRPRGDERTATTLLSAGGEALRRGAPDAALRYLRRALDEPPADAILVPVLVRLGQAGLGLGHPSAVAHLERALELSAGTDERVGVVRLLAIAYGFARRPADAVSVLDDVRRELPAGEREVALVLLGEACGHGLHLPSPPPLDGTLAELAGDTAGERLCLAAVASREIFTGDWRSAAATAATAERALAGGRLLEDQAADAPSFWFTITALALADRYDLVASMLELVEADARRRSTGAAQVLASAVRSTLERLRGNLPLAVANADEALERARALWPFGLPTVAHSAAGAYLAAGDLDKAERLFELVGDLPQDPWSNLAWVARANVHLARGRLDHALADATEAGGRTPPRAMVGGRWRLVAAQALHGKGATAEARELAQEYELLAREWGAPTELAIALRGHAVVCSPDTAVPRLREAVELAGAAGSVSVQAEALVDLGAAHRREGRRNDARRALREGLDVAYGCGARSLVAKAREELAALGVRPPVEPGTGAASLTPTEVRVARLAADGMSNRQIAETVFVTPKTVEMHLGRIYRKLGIASRAELAVALDPPERPTA